MRAMFWDTPIVTADDVAHFNTEKVTNYRFFMNGEGWEYLFE